MYHHLFRVCRLRKCRQYGGLNNSLGHISLESSRPPSFSEKLVQGCFCQWWSPSGVSWLHRKVSSSGSSYYICASDLISRSTLPVSPGFISSYAGLITARAFLGLLEGPVFPSMVLYLSGFYTRKELSLRYGSHGCHSSVDHPYIAHLESLYFSRQFQCVIKL